MSTTRDDLTDQIAELTELTKALRRALLKYERANMVLASLIQDNTPTIEALKQAGAPSVRPELTDALDQFAGARHRTRLALLALAVAEGASMAEAGRAFSVSRQLVSRMIKQHREDRQSQI